MTIFKKSRVAILSLGLMLLVAGYVNYKYNPDREKDLGQTVYVNGKDSFTYDEVSIYDSQGNSENCSTCEGEDCFDNCVEEMGVSEDLTGSDSDENVIAVFRYDRDNMFSELSETYSQMINNQSTSTEKVNEYQDKLNELKTKKNLIIMVEDVIKSIDIDDVVIIPTENENYNVIIRSSDEIDKEDIAKIQQILTDQLGADVNKVTITVKNS